MKLSEPEMAIVFHCHSVT